MPLRVLGGPLPTRKVRKLGAWTRPGNAWNGGESVGLIGGLIGGGGRRGGGRRRAPAAASRGALGLFNTGRPRAKNISAPPLFLARRGPPRGGGGTHPAPAPQTPRPA